MEFEYLWSMPNKCTFEMKPIKKILIELVFSHKNILIPFAGMTRFNGLNLPKITYIDIEQDRPKPCIYGDCLEVMQDLLNKQTNKQYDLIISDPPFCFFQAVHTYHNQKMQDISRCKELYDQLLKPSGHVLHFGFNSTGMGQNRSYKKQKLWVVNQGGSHNDLLILLEQKLAIGGPL